MSLFLKILIIFGKVLLGILLTALLLVFLVLFVPIFYKANVEYSEAKLDYKVKASWLLNLVSFSLTDKEGMRFKIFFFNLLKRKGDRFEDKEECCKANSIVINSKEDLTKDNINAVRNIEKEDDGEIDISALEEKCDSFENCSESSIKSEPSKNKDKDSTKTNLYGRIKRYIEIVKSERFKKAFSKAKSLVFSLLKHILPRKWEISGTVGFDDPSVTGEILAVLGMAYPFISKHIHIKGDFEDNKLAVNGYAKGHIVLIKVIVLGGILYFNKNIRRVIKMFREDKDV